MDYTILSKAGDDKFFCMEIYKREWKKDTNCKEITR